MIDGVIIKKLETFGDSRGWLMEIFRQDEFEHEPVMAYVSETKPGVIRGPHEHKNQSDFFAFLSGEFILYLWDNRQGAANYRQLEKIEVGEKNPSLVIVPPGVVHAYKCVSDQSGIIINLPNQLYKGKDKKEDVDEIRWEDMDDSPFVVD